ncbi:hypothetical protein DL98DRAFT_651018 [Cadophora sp. DSE1049]|nr:hypothetical protein DL98DRAFT_651018 [Cadophora sp. DSE1049]
MDSVSSSPLSGVEFGHLPRTPASNRSKNGRTSNGKENSRSGSLHKRIYDSLRFRSRSLSRSSDNGSPSAKPVKRRKSIVDLLNLSSREPQNDRDVQDQADPTKTEATTSKHNYSDLFSDMPKKRRSLGNLLNPTNILGAITKKACPKQDPGLQDSPVTNDGLIHEPLLVFLPKKPKEIKETPTDNPDNTGTDKHQTETSPLYAKLAEGSAVDIDLFESRLARILDSIITKKPGHNNKPEFDDSYLHILQEGCEPAEGGKCSGSPDSLRPMITPRNKTNSVTPSCTPEPAAPLTGELQANTDGEKRPKTPDSYLRLLIDSCGEPSQSNHLLSSVSSLQLSKTSSNPDTRNLNGDLNEDLKANQLFVDGEEIEISSIRATPASFVRSCQYQLREKTPDYHNERELVRQPAHDQRTMVKVREVSCSSTLLDLDPEFRQRQEERSEKYASLGLTGKSDWRCNQEEIAQSIASTVARMTRNYHSSSEDHIPRYQGTEANQRADESEFNQRCYGGCFEADLSETWDSVIVGRHLMLEDESIEGRESRASGDLPLLFNHKDGTSLVEFDDLSTNPRSSISEADPQARLCAKDILFPTAEEILEDSTVLRSPLEPFFAFRRTAKMDDSLDLDKEIDFCPEYEDFLRRSYGFLNQRPSMLLQQEMNLQTATPKFHEDQFMLQLLLSSSEKSHQIPASAVQVRFPGTVNLLQHTEYFPSMGDALSGLYNYKLGDLANFYVYDPAKRTIDAHLIDSPVPNPADLKNKGLQLHWITQLSSDTATDTTGDGSLLAESSHLIRRQPSRCDNAWEEFASEAANFLDEPYSTSYGLGKRSISYLSLPTDATGDKVISTTNSVFNDDFFLEDQSGQFSEQVSVADDSSAIRVLREASSEEEVVAALEFEGQVRATKTWAELAREVRGSTSREDETAGSSAGDEPQSSSQEDDSADEGASDNPRQHCSTSMRTFEESEGSSSKQQIASPNQIICSKPADYEFRYGGVDDADMYDSLDAPRESEAGGGASTLNEFVRLGCISLNGSEGLQNDLKQGTSSQDLQSCVNFELCDPLTSHILELPVTPHVKGKNSSGNRCTVVAEHAMERTDEIRNASASPDIVIDHSPGYHFTTVKHYMREESEESDGKNVKKSTQTVEALYDADDDTHNGIDSEYSDEDVASALPGIAKITVPAAATRNESLKNHKSHTVDPCHEKVLVESHPNSPRHSILDFRFESDINPTKDIERADLQENKVTLSDLNIRPVGKAARPSPLSAKGKSKVGALVNIFQDYGLLPEQSRGPLQMSSVSPSFSRQSSRYRGEPSGTSVDSGKVRRISATLSTGSRSIPSPVNRVATPNSIFDRPHSRISDIDTEASFHFGEILKRTRKHGESENEDTSIRDAEMYG